MEITSNSADSLHPRRVAVQRDGALNLSVTGMKKYMYIDIYIYIELDR